MRKKTLILFLFVSFSLNAVYAQFTAQRKARVIFNIAQETNWINENEIFTFNIAVFDEADSIINQFINYKKAGRRLKGKNIDIIKIEHLDFLADTLNVANIQILYLAKNKSNLRDTIAKLIRHRNILFVTDNAPDCKFSVINLTDNTDKYYELNYHNAKEHGLIMSENVLILGADEDLLRQMYLDSMRVLRRERQNVQYKIYQIEDQYKRLQLKEDQIKIKEKQLDSIEKVVSTLSFKIKSQRKLLYINRIELEKQKKIIEKQKLIYKSQLEKIDSINAELQKKEMEIKQKEQKIKNIDQELVNALQRVQTQADYIKLALLILLILLFVIYYFYQRNKRAKEIERQNIEIRKKNEEIERKNKELQKQQQIINEKNQELERINKNLTDSINYALRIQLALLPSSDIIENNFSDYFIIFKPKEIVSGDFYWFRQKRDKIFAVAADCTGHGVPGAFMSMLGMTFLSEITGEDIFEPHIILDKLRKKIIDALAQKDVGYTLKDGIDIALAVIDKQKKTIDFAGAYNPMLVVRKGSDNSFIYQEVKADRMPAGSYLKEYKQMLFTKKQVNYEPGDRIYLFSDGFKDQLGGKYYRKITKKRFYNLLLSVQNKDMQQQKTEIENFFDEWTQNGKYQQIDDVLIVGLTL